MPSNIERLEEESIEHLDPLPSVRSFSKICNGSIEGPCRATKYEWLGKALAIKLGLGNSITIAVNSTCLQWIWFG